MEYSRLIRLGKHGNTIAKRVDFVENHKNAIHYILKHIMKV